MFEGYEDTAAEELSNKVKAKRARTGGMDLIRGLFANPPLLFLLLTDFGKWLFNFSIAGTIVYYFKYIANDMPSMAWYTLIVAACSVLGAYFSRQIGKALGAKMTLVFGFVFMAVCLFIGRLMYSQMWLLISLIAAAQLFYGVTYSVASAMYADTAVFNEWKTGKNASGWIMGLINIPLKAAGTVTPFVLGALFASGGVNPNILPGAASAQVKDAIANTLLVVPGAVLLLGAIVLFFGYNLTKTKLFEMQKDIDERRAAEEAAGKAN
jgi:GPH family glycoside/pentoside/hexuronide:cation symporter